MTFLERAKKYNESNISLRGSKNEFKVHIENCLKALEINDATIESMLTNLSSHVELKGYSYNEYCRSLRKYMKDEESFTSLVLKLCYFSPITSDHVVKEFVDMGAQLGRDIVNDPSKNVPDSALHELGKNLKEKILLMDVSDFVHRLMDLPSCISETCLKYIPFNTFSASIGPLIATLPTSTTTTSTTTTTTTTAASAPSTASSEIGDANILIEKIAQVIKSARGRKDSELSAIGEPQTIIDIERVAKRDTSIIPKAMPIHTRHDNQLVMKAILYLSIRIFYRVTLFKVLHGSPHDYFYNDFPGLRPISEVSKMVEDISEQDFVKMDGKRYLQDLMPWYYVVRSEIAGAIAFKIVKKSTPKDKDAASKEVIKLYTETVMRILMDFVPAKQGRHKTDFISDQMTITTVLDSMTATDNEKANEYLADRGVDVSKLNILNYYISNIDDRIFGIFSNSDSGLIKIMLILTYYFGGPGFESFVYKMMPFTQITF